MANTQDLIAIPNNLDPILWIGNVSQISLPQFFPFQKKEVEIIFKASPSEALLLISRDKFSAIVVQNSDEYDSLEFLVQSRQLQPFASRILISEKLNEVEVREGINKAQVFRFISLPIDVNEMWIQLEKALLRHSMYLSNSLLLKESSRQNKELEALTHSLEGLVEERTKFIELSHNEESEKLHRERQLVRFIKDLGTQNSFEEILGILRKELRKFHKMGDPILAYRLGDNKTFFLSFHLGHFTQTESLVAHEFPEMAKVPSSELVRYFANHFGRPFVKAYVVPLELRLTNQFVGREGEAILCIENSLNEKEMAPFIDFMMDRMRPLSMALDRVLLEHQLSSFSYRWEKTFDGMRDPIAIVDVDFNVVRANRKFSDRFMHRQCYESFANRSTPCEGCPVPEALKKGQSESSQITVDGRVFQVQSYPVLIDQNSRPTNIVNQYVDITQSRELYLRMLQSEKMGAIGALAGNIAHELNNPLTGLRSLSQVLLQEVPKEGNLYADLQEIEKATARSQRIIKNLLDFSKGEDQPSEVISVDEVVNRTLPMLKSVLRSHSLDVNLGTAEELVFVEPHLLQQVVFNLINNACQAMKENGKLSVETKTENNFIVINISDTGPGIPADVQRRIFEPFFTTKKEGHGTGLGLSMSKSIIEKFGGTIGFANLEPRGTCFSIVLPRHCPG